MTRIINAAAPIRICDNGGWTDTWFAGHGTIFNIGVSPYVEVQVAVRPRAAHRAPVMLHAENYAESYALVPGAAPLRHPLLEATIAEMALPDLYSLDITIHSDVLGGASTGTSAAVCVALIGALGRLTGCAMTPGEVARRAHRVETERLGLQSGIQDQICAAYGGINFIEMARYPEATVTPLVPPDSVWWELDQRMLLFFLGKTHQSSAVHEQVIAGLERTGGAALPLQALRAAAERSRAAVLGGDWAALGQAMIRNTDAQRALHPALVSADADALIALGREHGVLGWKVNGAGGEGGSVTLLCGPAAAARRALLRAVRAMLPHVRHIPTRISRHGLRVWETSAE